MKLQRIKNITVIITSLQGRNKANKFKIKQQKLPTFKHIREKDQGKKSSVRYGMTTKQQI